MNTSQTIEKLADELNINKIYARHVFHSADKTRLFEDAARIVNEKPKPFVKWVGGKRQLLRQFRDMGLYPPDDFDPLTNTYFEPFVGGGAVFFDLLPKKAELSDLNSELVTTYNVIKNHVDELIKSLKKHKYDKQYYMKVRARQPEDLSDVEIASRFIYLNRTGFNGMYRVNSKGKFNVPFGKYTNPIICDEENLRKVSKALQKITIKKQDYNAVLKKMKLSIVSPYVRYATCS